ncbi:MAG: PD-(D/E)XK nuclease family protein, partial [Clostridiaceae bacterium]|nr:PD-(D/E)XK nuclease family protein [Clostridiaceae bacterium]
MTEFVVSSLLSLMDAISQKHALLAEETGQDFNIFKITDIASKEVLMCRVLYELLSPKGCHN